MHYLLIPLLKTSIKLTAIHVIGVLKIQAFRYKPVSQNMSKLYVQSFATNTFCSLFQLLA